MVEDMIAYALRDFLNVPVGLVSEGHHNIPLRASMVAMTMNLANRLGNMRLPETALLAVFGIQNSFIVHLVIFSENSRKLTCLKRQLSNPQLNLYISAHTASFDQVDYQLQNTS